MSLTNESEIKKLLLSAKNSNWYLEILLGLFCGLRKGEIMGLKFSDFDFEKSTVKIQRQLIPHHKLEVKTFKVLETTLVEREPKTKNSYRTLRVPSLVLEEVKKRQNIIIQYKEKLKDKFIDNDYVSCQQNGLPHAAPSLNAFLNNLCIKNSIPKITVHGLRHMFATILIEQRVKLAKISALLGHSSVNTTFDIYCSVMKDRERITAFMNDTFPVEEC